MTDFTLIKSFPAITPIHKCHLYILKGIFKRGNYEFVNSSGSKQLFWKRISMHAKLWDSFDFLLDSVSRDHKNWTFFFLSKSYKTILILFDLTKPTYTFVSFSSKFMFVFPWIWLISLNLSCIHLRLGHHHRSYTQHGVCLFPHLKGRCIGETFRLDSTYKSYCHENR